MYSFGNFSAFFLWSPLGNYEKKSCLNKLKFWEASRNQKRSICWKFQLSISLGTQKGTGAIGAGPTMIKPFTCRAMVCLAPCWPWITPGLWRAIRCWPGWSCWGRMTAPAGLAVTIWGRDNLVKLPLFQKIWIFPPNKRCAFFDTWTENVLRKDSQF